jgi:hypothetical protein
MQKWSVFSMGLLAGVVGVLLTVVLMQNRELKAEAATPLQASDNTGQGLMLATGGATANQNDIIWIVYKRPAPKRAGADTRDVLSKDERITLCAYQVANGARNIKLSAVRDISFDMDLIEYMNDRPHVKDIAEELRKQLKAQEAKEK